MTRALHIGLLVMALLGLIGQSTAMAMAPTSAMTQSMQASKADMECSDMAKMQKSEKSPCKNMTLQCMATMGCAPMALVAPGPSGLPSVAIISAKTEPTLASRLFGRSFGPEPDPPSFLI